MTDVLHNALLDTGEIFLIVGTAIGIVAVFAFLCIAGTIFINGKAAGDNWFTQLIGWCTLGVAMFYLVFVVAVVKNYPPKNDPALTTTTDPPAEIDRNFDFGHEHYVPTF